MASLLLWAVIITVCEEVRIFSSRVEYFSAHRYISSMVFGGLRERDWKKGVVGPNLLRKLCKTTSILQTSICWTTCPNLRVKSQMDSSSHLKMDWSKLMFPFCRTEHRY